MKTGRQTFLDAATHRPMKTCQVCGFTIRRLLGRYVHFNDLLDSDHEVKPTAIGFEAAAGLRRAFVRRSRANAS